MKPAALDHMVINVSDIDAAAVFYARALNANIVRFGEGRVAIQIGEQKLNLHQPDTVAVPKARHPATGGADLCILSDSPMVEIVRHLKGADVQIVEGPVPRTGATGPITSVYIFDPDGNLIEIANRDT